MSHITITPHQGTIRVIAADRVLATTDHALDLKEGSYPAVLYVPRDAAVMALLERTARRSHCPHKGDASYFSIVVGDTRIENAVWSYEHPFEAVAAIKDHLAFYPQHVTIEG